MAMPHADNEDAAVVFDPVEDEMGLDGWMRIGGDSS